MSEDAIEQNAPEMIATTVERRTLEACREEQRGEREWSILSERAARLPPRRIPECTQAWPVKCYS